MRALGIDIDAGLQRAWQRWLAPDVQPFFVESIRAWPSGVGEHELGRELGQTYRRWRVDRSLEVLWLDEPTFASLSRAQRSALVRAQVGHGRGAVPSVRRWSDVLDAEALRSQADGRRFVWWPTLVASNPDVVLERVIRTAPAGDAPDGLPSRHDDVESATWSRAGTVLPDARRLAGTFASSTAANCFAAVMAAAGVDGAEHEYMLQEPFQSWLEAETRPGGHHDEPGTVLVWRSPAGLPVHAAVTLGDGWALEKASGEWWTPIAVRSARDVIRSARAPGQRLERHALRRVQGPSPRAV